MMTRLSERFSTPNLFCKFCPSFSQNQPFSTPARRNAVGLFRLSWACPEQHKRATTGCYAQAMAEQESTYAIDWPKQAQRMRRALPRQPLSGGWKRFYFPGLLRSGLAYSFGQPAHESGPPRPSRGPSCSALFAQPSHAPAMAQ